MKDQCGELLPLGRGKKGAIEDRFGVEPGAVVYLSLVYDLESTYR